jgi:hypothetical protein
VGVNLLTDRGFGWRPLEAAPSPSVPLSLLVDISLVGRGRGGEGRRGGGIWRWLWGAVLLYVAWTKVNTVLDEGKHSTDEGKHSTDEGKHSTDEGKHSTDEEKHSRVFRHLFLQYLNSLMRIRDPESF